RTVPLPRKIRDAQEEAGIAERCVATDGADAPLELCDATVDATIYSSPRIEAGGGDAAPVNGVGPGVVGFTDDRLDCETMPIDDWVYAGQTFSDVFTSAQQDTLRGAFPTGVCDYSRPGNGFQAALTWLRYQDSAGAVVYGGVPMGPPPVSVYFAPTRTAPSPTAARDGLPATGGDPRLPVLAALLLAGFLLRSVTRPA
ncbi:MAG TPA: DUF6351 family protein, partial [Acidimicrobiales bacterium]|nr:DUF6351 family protein [Acidimicrobiales bacterium]